MHYFRRKGWEIPASSATPEALFVDRRAVLAGLGASGALAGFAGRARAEDADPSASLYPAKRNEAFTLDREVTPEKYNLNDNNFYEFSTSKRIDASALKTRPWTVKLDGMIEKEQTVDIDTLIRTIGLEERLYRHRCVEAWSMAIPWTGFPLRGSSISRAAVRGQVRAVRDLPRQENGARPAVLRALALHRGPDDRKRPMTSPSSRPALTASRSPRFRAPRSAQRALGNTDSNPSSRLSGCRSSIKGQRRSVRCRGRRNTGSGPMSIPTRRIRAEAKRAKIS